MTCAFQVIRVCSMSKREEVIEAAQKLINNADSIRQYIDLSNVNLAIDDCYQMWESGFISIPYDFQLKDLRPQLQKMLLASAGDSMLTSPAEDYKNYRDVSNSCFGKARRARQIPHNHRMGRVWRRSQYMVRWVRPSGFVIPKNNFVSVLR